MYTWSVNINVPVRKLRKPPYFILGKIQHHIHWIIVQDTSAIAGHWELNIGPEIGRCMSITTHSGSEYAVLWTWKLEFIGYVMRADTGPAIFGWVTIATR